MAEINVQFYGTRKLESREFQLSGDPYEYADGKPDSVVAKELRDYGIFFWRDEYHPNGVLIPPLPEFPVQGFYFQVILDEDDFFVPSWGNPNPETVKKAGDDLAWIMFNKDARIIEMNSSEVRVQR